MLAHVTSVALVGTEALPVEVEVFIGQGMPGCSIVGLPARCVREAEHRTRAAIEAADKEWPQRKIVASLAPGALRKDGTHFDLALALGVLRARSDIPEMPLGNHVVVGELGLDGTVRPVPGVLAAAMLCRDLGRPLICPAPNAAEASLVDGVEIVPASDLGNLISYLCGAVAELECPPAEAAPPAPCEDMSEIRGHAAAKRAAEIAAAGGHNLLIEGPPGSGKSMLASRIPGILPSVTNEEALEITRIYSIAGLLPANGGLITRRPFRSPHHHVSLAGLIGGGVGLPRPGEISLAHRGVLFLDELTLYRREVLEALRAPLEDGRVSIARSGGAICFPCSFSLVAAMNPCPCGYRNDGRRRCRCGGHELERYGAKLSGPLIDRMDMRIEMGRLSRRELLDSAPGESTEAIRGRVDAARTIQHERFGPGVCNASAPSQALRGAANLTAEAHRHLGMAIDAMDLSGRAVDRIVRVARTIADLEGSRTIAEDHVGNAITYRLRDPAEELAA